MQSSGLLTHEGEKQGMRMDLGIKLLELLLGWLERDHRLVGFRLLLKRDWDRS
jgi:hypothetical protein